MSKRFFPQQYGDRKKAKLDVTISDHNFPLSQNAAPSKDTKPDTWGDDNDDEILLLASQVCEDAYNISSLPDYSMCMQPARTSTQLDPVPSTSKSSFTFKKPNLPRVPSLTKDSCRISSPLPGMSSKIQPKNNDITDDLIFNDKIYKEQVSDYMYRQLLQLQEENAKLKSENGKLLDKCVTKEGEASILRTQLKTSQSAVDNARLERIKAQEKAQMEWNDKLAIANNQMQDLRNQLDFKNLEIISIKERCRMLESNKVKLTQVNVSHNDISTSHRNNISQHIADGTVVKKVKTASGCVQTENKAHFLVLNKSYRSEPSKLSSILPLILEPSSEQHSLLDCNEKLRQTDLSQHNKCRIFSTFHRIPSTLAPKAVSKPAVSLNSLHEDLTCVAMERDGYRKRYRQVLETVKSELQSVCSQLDAISERTTTAFLREMDEKYLEATNMVLQISETDLVGGRCLYKDEQAIVARRLTAALAHTLHSPPCLEEFHSDVTESGSNILELVYRICTLLETTSCAVPYSSLLLSFTLLIALSPPRRDVIARLITCRPSPFVSLRVVKLVRRLEGGGLCAGGNLKVDYDQGVLLYKKESCPLQVLWKQVEACLKCESRVECAHCAADLIAIYAKLDVGDANSRCDCQIMLLQIIVYALRICSTALKESSNNTEVSSVCRSGVQLLYGCLLRDSELYARLGTTEGDLAELCEISVPEGDHVYANMLSELSAAFQSVPDDVTSSFHKEAWVRSFDDILNI